jgi:hypothetical protein
MEGGRKGGGDRREGKEINNKRNRERGKTVKTCKRKRISLEFSFCYVYSLTSMYGTVTSIPAGKAFFID